MKKIILCIFILMFIAIPYTYASTDLYNRAIEEMTIPKGALEQAKNAISGGALRIAFWGDSITEGGNIMDPNDQYSVRVTNALIDALPGINVTSQNFALGSRTIALANNPNYVAISAEPADITQGFFRPWSIIGKSWMDHIKDFQPDLLIVAFGMNDSWDVHSDINFYNNLISLTNFVKSWPKVPSIVLTSTILPTKNTSYTTQRQDITNSVARSTREFAKQNGYALADANRLFQILRDGTEEVTRQNVTEFNWNPFPNGWSGNVSNFTLSGNTLVPNVPNNSFISRSSQFYNGFIQVDIKPVTDGDQGVTWINYRSSDLGRFTLQVRSGSGTGSLELYADSTLLNSVSSLNIPTNNYTTIKIIANGIHHKVFVNGTMKMDFVTYQNLHEGNVGIGSDMQLGSFQNMQIGYQVSLTSDPMYSESDLIGQYNTPTAEGNGINHPTGLGHALIYFPAFYNIIKKLSD